MNFRDSVLDVEALKHFFKVMIWLEIRRLSSFVERYGRLLLQNIFPFYFSLIGTALAILIYIKLIPMSIDGGGLAPMLLTCAAVLGSFVVLASTLSIIPAQNSMTSLTPLVRTFLNGDLRSQLSFALTAVFTIALLILSTMPSSPTTHVGRFVTGILLTSISFDLIRLYQRSILRLMEPGRAIALMVQTYSKYLTKCRRDINEVIRKQVSDQNGVAASVIRTSYQKLGVNETIRMCFAELAEVARRGVKNSDHTTCEKAVDGLIAVFFNYLAARKDTLALISEPSEIGIYRTSDVRELIVALLERLKTINREAITTGNESISQKVIKAHQAVGMTLISLTIVDRDREESVPDTSMVLAYLNDCTLAAAKVGMEDVVLDAARAIQQMALRARPNVRNEHFYGKATPTVSGFSFIFYAANKPALANEVSKTLMVLAERVIAENHFQKEYIFGEVLRHYQILLPLSMKMPGGIFSTLDAYATTGEHSFLTLTELCLKAYADSIEAGAEAKNKFRAEDLSQILNQVFDHFRTIGPNVAFTDAMTHWNIVEYFKLAGELLFNLRFWDKVSEHEKAMIDDLIFRFSLLPGWVFAQDKPFTAKNAADAAEVVATFGLRAMDCDIPNIPSSCIRTIKDLFEKTRGQHQNSFAQADVLVNLWIIRRFAAVKTLTEVITEIDLILENPIGDGTPEQLVEILNAVENRKGHLEDDLNRHNRWSRGDARDILYDLLNNTPAE